MFGYKVTHGIKEYSIKYGEVQVKYTNNNSNSSLLYLNFNSGVSFDLKAEYLHKGVMFRIDYLKEKFKPLTFSINYFFDGYNVTIKPDQVEVTHRREIGTLNHTVFFNFKKDGLEFRDWGICPPGDLANSPDLNAYKQSCAHSQDPRSQKDVCAGIKNFVIPKLKEHSTLLKEIQSNAYQELLALTNFPIPEQYLSDDKALMGGGGYMEFFKHLDYALV